MFAPALIVAAHPGCELGENPLWDPEQRCIYWTDIPAGKIHSFAPATRKHQLLYQGPPVGGFTLQKDGSLLLFRVNDFAALHRDGRVVSLREFSEAGMNRFNDVIADPAGRVYAGTIGTHPQCGLYRVDLDGTITKMFAGTGCSNGMGFALDGRTFYWTCSTTRRIYQFAYDRASGNLSERKLFYETTIAEGIPDGLTVDTAGNVWSARWGGAAIMRHDREGRVQETLSFPAPNMTSLCFGGEHLDTLFATSAQEPGLANDSAGALFEMPATVRGRLEFRSQILIS